MYLFVWLFRPKSKQFPEILALGDDAFRYSLKQHVKTQYEDDSNLTCMVCFSFKFEDSELLDKLIGDDTYEKCPEKGRVFTMKCIFLLLKCPVE